MIEHDWFKIEGTTDSNSDCDSVAARAVDSGIEIAYVCCGCVRTLTIQGVFHVCRMSKTGFNIGVVAESIQPGDVAVPIQIGDKCMVLVIGADYEMSALTPDEIPDYVSLVDMTEEDDLDKVSSDIVQVLNLM